MQKNKIIQNVSLLIFYLLFAPPTLAAVKDSIHGAFSGVMAWDLFYNILGGAGGGVIQVVRNLQNPHKYSNNIAVGFKYVYLGFCRIADLFIRGRNRHHCNQRLDDVVSELLRRGIGLRSNQALHRRFPKKPERREK